MTANLYPIYYKGKRVTKANYYYSPRGMFGKTPSFLVGVVNPEQYRQKMAGLDENEIILYFIPPEVERRIGKELRKRNEKFKFFLYFYFFNALKHKPGIFNPI